jgi:hypothetical protein
MIYIEKKQTQYKILTECDFVPQYYNGNIIVHCGWVEIFVNHTLG